MSVKTLAYRFGITPTYLSYFFKEQTGCNFLEFVSKLRITKSKELLENPDLTIADIAIQIGYGNDIAFTRAFKKNEGVTPSKYRDILSKERRRAV